MLIGIHDIAWLVRNLGGSFAQVMVYSCPTLFLRVTVNVNGTL